MRSSHELTATVPSPVKSGPSHDIVAKPAGDGEVKSRWASPAPSREVDVSRPPVPTAIALAAIFQKRIAHRPGLKEAGSLEFWVEVGTIRKEIYFIAEQIVPFSPVPAARTDQTMVTEPVDDAIAQWTIEFRVVDWNPKLSLYHGAVEGWVDMRA